MSSPLIVVVTGANRGIGQAICEGVLRLPKPVTLYACSRAGSPFDLTKPSGSSKVHFSKLDISDSESIKALKDLVEKQEGGVDALINNAGVNLDQQYNLENAKKTLDVNYRGTLEVCQQFMPLLKARNGRIATLSSVGSMIKSYSPDIQSRFRNVQSLEDVEALAQEYIASVEAKQEREKGWFSTNRSYSVSKACINAFTIVLAKENPEVVNNCCCPGWVATDMGRQVGDQPPKTTEEGARVPLKIAFDDINGITGKYWANTSIRSTESGDVQDW